MMTDNTALQAARSELIGTRVRIFLRGRMWQANFQTDGRQRRVSLGTSIKKEARRRAVQLESEIAAGRWQPPRTPVTLTEVKDAYLDSLVARTGRQARCAKNQFDVPGLGFRSES
jgi:hypothetical protein